TCRPLIWARRELELFLRELAGDCECAGACCTKLIEFRHHTARFCRCHYHLDITAYGRASFILGGLVLTFEMIPESIWIPTYGLAGEVENCAEACTSVSTPSLLQMPKQVKESVSYSTDRREVDARADA